MRHYKKGRKLGSDASHTTAIKKNLMVNLFLNDRIKTTLERAKETRGDVDRIITWAKRGTIHSRRLAIAKLGDKALVAEIFAKVEQGLFKDRPGGYTRIYKVGKRRGDDATIVLMELVQEPVQFKKKAVEVSDDDTGSKGGLKVKKKLSKTKNAPKEQEPKEATEEASVPKGAEEISAEDAAAEEAPIEAGEALVDSEEQTQKVEEASAEDESEQ